MDTRQLKDQAESEMRVLFHKSLDFSGLMKY
jgi:hypothetical protein